MALLERQPILVWSAANPEDVDRHLRVRGLVVDAIVGHEPYRQLLDSWRDGEIRAVAAEAHDAFVAFAGASGLEAHDVDFAFGGRLVGRVVQARHVLDEPTPPAAETLRVGAFVDRLLGGEATVEDLAEVVATGDGMQPGPRHLDLRSPMPLGSMSRAVEVSQSPEGRARREPLEALLAELDVIWGEQRDRHADALRLLADLHFGDWPALATDLVVRYGAGVLAIVRGEPARWEYRVGDPSRGEAEPPGLEIPAFEPSGDAAADQRRIRLWLERTAQVAGFIEAAAGVGATAHRPTRPVRSDEATAFRRNTDWLYRNLAEGQSLVALARDDLGSTDRWRDVQRALHRTRDLLALGADTMPTA